jgi:hypothetical protein
MNLEAAAPCQTSNMLKRRGQREKETVTISLLGVSPRQLATHRAEEHLVQHSKKTKQKNELLAAITENPHSIIPVTDR